MWSAAAAAHLLQGSMCCVQRCSSKYLGCNLGYMSYCCLPVTAWSRLAINPTSAWELFCPENCPSGPFSLNPKSTVCGILGAVLELQLCQIQSLTHHLFLLSDSRTSASHLDHVCMPKCPELLPDYLPSQAAEPNKVDF